MLSESIGALALVPLGLLFKPHYLLRHRNPKLLLETLVTTVITLVLCWAAITWLPWPFTCVIVLLMWSAVRLPRMEAYLVFLATIMMVSLMMARNPASITPQDVIVAFNAPWLPFLMMLLPANVMTMVMYAFRAERKHITESEERFRNAMEYSAIGMALVGIEGQWLQANKALCNFLGYSQTELQSLTFQQLTWPEDLNTDLEQLEQLVSGEINTYTLEKRYYTRNGEVVWALLAVSVVRHADGTPLYFIAQIEDINDLKQTEWVNKRLMERITLANEAGGIGIWEWDLEPDIISWDKRMFELYEIPPHIKPTWQLWHDAMVPEDREHAEKVLRDSLIARLPFKLEFRIRVKDGIRHIRSLANRVLNKQGEVERLLGINMDMTEVKQLNEALFQEKERLHITLDSIGEAVICTDIDMNVTFMNPVAEKMSGWPQTEAIGQPILRVLHITFGENGPLMENIHSGDMSRSDIEQDVVLNYILHSWSLVKIGTTASQKKLFFNLRRLKGQMQAIDDGDLKPEQVNSIATTLGVPEQDVVSMNQRLAAPDHSLNAPLRIDGEGEWQDWLVDDNENQEQTYAASEEFSGRKALLDQAMMTLNERERHILAERRLKEEPSTLEDLSHHYNVSRERIRQIEARAMEKLQKAMSAEVELRRRENGLQA